MQSEEPLRRVSQLAPAGLLKNTLLLAAQHILPSTLEMFHQFHSLGLDYSKICVIGKCYSSDPNTIEHMRYHGIEVAEESSEFIPHVPFDLQYKSNVAAFFLNWHEKTCFDGIERVIVMDDGGVLLATVNNYRSKVPISVVGVEQTSSGYNLISKLKLNFPIINVARSWAKLGLESNWIADQSAHLLSLQLSSIDHTPKQALILGYGAIGEALYRNLNPKLQITVVDPKKTLGDAFLKNKLDNIDKAALSKFDLILGCSGVTSFSADLLDFLGKETVLASFSSSDRELDSAVMRLRADAPINHCHENVQCGNALLLSCGFPISFQGDPALVDPPQAYFTRGLLMAGAFAAKQLSIFFPKILDLPNNLQNHIVYKLRPYLMIPYTQYCNHIAESSSKVQTYHVTDSTFAVT